MDNLHSHSKDSTSRRQRKYNRDQLLLELQHAVRIATAANTGFGTTALPVVPNSCLPKRANCGPQILPQRIVGYHPPRFGKDRVVERLPLRISARGECVGQTLTLHLGAECARPTLRRYAVNCPILLRTLENAKMRRCERHCYVEGMKGVRIRRVPLNMSRKHPECCNPLDQSVVADLTLRQEPDEEEEKTKRKTKTTALKTMTVTEKTTATRSRVLAQSRLLQF